MVGDISLAAIEQSRGISRVNSAVNELDRMTQQNAALSEESTAATESLKVQAEQLSQAVGTFRIAAHARSRDLTDFDENLG